MRSPLEIARRALRWASPRGGLARGRAALARGFPLEALREWQAAQRAGSREAAYLIGRLYLEGQGLRRNPAEAAFWFDEASRGGHVAAKYELASLLIHGAGDGGVAHWIASARGHASEDVVTRNISALFPYGFEIAADPAQAARLFAEAAAEGHVAAQATLGALMLEGRGCEKDAEAARASFPMRRRSGIRRRRIRARRYLFPGPRRRARSGEGGRVL